MVGLKNVERWEERVNCWMDGWVERWMELCGQPNGEMCDGGIFVQLNERMLVRK